MREIKFRAWDRYNERMVEPRNILKIYMSRLNQEPYLIVYLKKWMNPNKEIKEIDKCYTNEFELMQYTGLKDRNGVEIYEGDVLRNIDNPHVDKLPFKVVWSDYYGAWFWWSSEGEVVTDYFYQSIAKCCEIIGNIHEGGEEMTRERKEK